jgi:hypothetical protein
MNFTLVNKNLLIPQVETYSDFNSPVQKLLNMTYNMDKLYCSNLYIVSSECIYFSNNNCLYSVSETNIIKKMDINIPNNSFLNSMNSFLNLNSINHNIDNLDAEMNINVRLPEHRKIIIEDSNVNSNSNDKNDSKQQIELNTRSIVKTEIKEKQEIREKTKEEHEIIKLCEETMEIYQNEVRKMKEIEQQIKVLDNNKKSLLKKRKEKLFTNFSKLKNDYNTFKMIQRKFQKKPDMDIPSLFILKYNYFEEIIKIESDIKILEVIHDMNLDEVLNKDCELNDELIDYVNKYEEESKKFNVKFEHSWEDLEYETESIENNNSKLGGI